jgi:hypothetical protein
VTAVRHVPGCRGAHEQPVQEGQAELAADEAAEGSVDGEGERIEERQSIRRDEAAREDEHAGLARHHDGGDEDDRRPHCHDRDAATEGSGQDVLELRSGGRHEVIDEARDIDPQTDLGRPGLERSQGVVEAPATIGPCRRISSPDSANESATTAERTITTPATSTKASATAGPRGRAGASSSDRGIPYFL